MGLFDIIGDVVEIATDAADIVIAPIEVVAGGLKEAVKDIKDAVT